MYICINIFINSSYFCVQLKFGQRVTFGKRAINSPSLLYKLYTVQKPSFLSSPLSCALDVNDSYISLSISSSILPISFPHNLHLILLWLTFPPDFYFTNLLGYLIVIFSFEHQSQPSQYILFYFPLRES